jgi:hypothetical protein
MTIITAYGMIDYRLAGKNDLGVTVLLPQLPEKSLHRDRFSGKVLTPSPRIYLLN